MRALIYFWSYGTGHEYVPEGNLLSPARRWRVFQLRQYFVFAVECLWTLFLARIHNSYFTPTEYLDWLVSELDLGMIGEQFGVPFPESTADRMTLSEFQEAIEHAGGDARFKPSRTPYKGN